MENVEEEISLKCSFAIRKLSTNFFIENPEKPYDITIEKLIDLHPEGYLGVNLGLVVSVNSYKKSSLLTLEERFSLELENSFNKTIRVVYSNIARYPSLIEKEKSLFYSFDLQKEIRDFLEDNSNIVKDFNNKIKFIIDICSDLKDSLYLFFVIVDSETFEARSKYWSF